MKGMTGEKRKDLWRRLAVFSVSTLVLAAVLTLFHVSVPTDQEGSAAGTGRRPATEDDKGLDTVAGRYHRGERASSFQVDPFCSRCHPSPAHQRDPARRSILNHHTTGMHCLICHGRDFMDYSKMTVLREMEGGRRVLWPTLDNRPLGPEEEESWRDQVTRSAECFPPGPECVECHRPGGLLDFDRLGYEKEKADGMKKMAEFLILRPGQRWFFPEVF